MKLKVILSLGAALLVAVPATTFARGSGDDNPLKMMQQMFRGTPFSDVIDNVPGNDRGRSKDDDGGRAGRGKGRDGGDDDGGRAGRGKGRDGGDDDGGRAGRRQQTDFDGDSDGQGSGKGHKGKGKRKKNRD